MCIRDSPVGGPGGHGHASTRLGGEVAQILQADALVVLAVAVQFLLGVFTLLHAVPVGLGVAHQAGAVLVLVITVAAAHWSMGGARNSVGSSQPSPSTRTKQFG